MAPPNQCRHSQATTRNHRDPSRLRGAAAERTGGAHEPVRAVRAASAAARLLFGFTLLISVATNAQVPEPEGYRMDDYRTPTPQTVAGGTVLDTTAAYKLWESDAAVWIDVLPAPRRPANLPASALWMPLPHRGIPGSIWLPDIGRGGLSPELEGYFRRHLEAVAAGRKDAAIVFY